MAQSFAQKLNLKPGQALALVNPPQGMAALDEGWSAMRFRREEGSRS